MLESGHLLDMCWRAFEPREGDLSYICIPLFARPDAFYHAFIDPSSSKLQAERVASERARDLERLSDLQAQERDLVVKLKHYEDRDPTVLKKLGENISTAMEHATRWGGNLAAIRSPLITNPYSLRLVVKNLNEYVRVACRDYVQEEANYDIERFDGRFGVSGLDCGPISWSNYKRLFPPPEPVCFRQCLFSSVFTVRDS